MEKLYWQTIHDVEFSKEHDFLEQVLTSNGVEDTYEFLHVNKTHTHDPFLLKNMKRGIKLLHNNLGKDKYIFIKVDPDVDGFTSAAYLLNFIKIISPQTNVLYGLNYQKEHGIFFNDIVNQECKKFDLIIVPDAGSGAESIAHYKKIKETYGGEFLTIDHHGIDHEVEEYTCLVNCTDGQYPNPTLSGVGVVHKFCLAYAREYGINEELCNYFLDLVSLGLVADAMDMRNLETRYYALEGLKEENRHNLLIKELSERFAEDMKLGFTLDSIGWTIGPKLNGTIRYGTEEEQTDLFRALCGEHEDREYQPRKERGAPKDAPKPPIEIHSLQKTMARVCGNVKNRQDTAVRSYMKLLDDEIKKKELDKNSIIAIDATDIVDKKTVTGLVANKLTDIYKRPILILKSKDDEMLGGSGRGYDKGIITDLNSFLNKTKLIECAGHPMAFGVSLKKNNLQALIDECNKQIKLEDLVTIHTVDYEVNANDLDPEAIMKVAEAYEVWGKGVPEPTFAITNIIIPAMEIIGYGENNGFIKFKYNDIDFIKKYCKKTDFEEMTLRDRSILGENKKIINLTLIGNFVLNEWDGQRYPQVKIKHFYAEENKEETIDSILEKIAKPKVNKSVERVQIDDFDLDFLF